MIYKRGEDIGRGEKQPASSRRCEGGEEGGEANWGQRERRGRLKSAD